jgi:DNA-binding transcriptional MerR regulator
MSEASILFDDGKAPDAFRTIGEVSAVLGLRPHVLRYWEEQFPALNPVKRAGGRRLYRPQDVQLIATIDRLVHREGYTLRGARLAIEGGAAEPASQQVVVERPVIVEKPVYLERVVERQVAPDHSAMLADLLKIKAKLTQALAH